MKKKKQLPYPLYLKILEVMPMVYADVVLVHEGKFLLLKRNISPMKGYWLTPGGRLEKGERLEAAARREALEETGLHVQIKKLLGIEEYVQRIPGNKKRHCINFYYQAILSPRSRNRIALDFESSDSGWFTNIPSKTPSYLKRMLREAGFK